MVESNPHIVNQLNQRLVEIVNNEGSIEFLELLNEYPELAIVPVDILWYTANSLAEDRNIRLERNNGALILYSVEL